MTRTIALLLTLACLNVSAAMAQSAADITWSVETVTGDLDYPWDIEAAGDVLIIAEKSGNIVMIDGDNRENHALQTSDPVFNEGGGGLLGMALAEDFAQSGQAYFYHTYQEDDGRSNRIIAAHFDGAGWTETAILLDGIPGHRLYNGGRVAIGPDGLLYATTGWTEKWDLPQDLTSLAGKTLRMALDGSIPADNPFPGSFIYSYGHRNPQGLSWNEAGEMFVAEHGQSARDEINLVHAGGNYGWPLVTGVETGEGLEAPWLHSGSSTWAPSGITHRGSELLMAALVGRGLYAVNEADGAPRPLFTSDNRLRDVLVLGDDIYVITTNRSPRGEGPSNDSLLRLSPHGA